MSPLRVKSINSDSCFVLSFTPPHSPHAPDGIRPEPFTILIDPWLSGSSTVWNSKFAASAHTSTPCVDSLRHLPEPDLVIVSQDMSDHCHRDTLTQLPFDTTAKIVAPAAAVKRIQSWKHFLPSTVHTLPRYDENDRDTVYRYPVRASGPPYSSGEVTISFISPKRDMTGMHNAIGITYRPPPNDGPPFHQTCVQLPMTPPATPKQDSDAMPLDTSLLDRARQRPISVLYSPHGVDYKHVKAYASSHLVKETALPLNALLHSTDRVQNSWFLGGTICTGSPGGVQIARNLYAEHWISAHDEDKINRGLSTKTLRIEKYDAEQISRLLEEEVGALGSGVTSQEKPAKSRTTIHRLKAGEDAYVGPF